MERRSDGINLTHKTVYRIAAAVANKDIHKHIWKQIEGGMTEVQAKELIADLKAGKGINAGVCVACGQGVKK